MTRSMVAALACLSVAVPAWASPASVPGSFVVAQVPPGATGGPSGGPNQAQAVVPAGATGGRSGGPNQAQYKKHAKSKKKHH